MKNILKWFENFWYHHKWKVVIISFFAITGIVILAQFITKTEYDSMILYTGPTLPTANATRDIENAFEAVISEDYNNDGDYTVSLKSLFLMTDKQLDDEKYMVDENGNELFVNTAEMVKTKEQFTTHMFAGEALICLLDPAWYDLVYVQDAFVPIEELIGGLPNGAYNDCALYLYETEFGKYFTALQALPEDTLICFRRMSTSTAFKNKKKEEIRYEFNKELFIDILEFSIE